MTRLACAVMLLSGCAAMSAHAECLTEDQKVSLSGRITLEFVPASDDPVRRAFTYPLMHLDKLFCYISKDFGNADGVQQVALAGNDVPDYKACQHVTATGELMRTVVADQPPQDFMLLMYDKGK